MGLDRKTKRRKKLLVIMEPRKYIVISCIYIYMSSTLSSTFLFNIFCKETYGNGMVMVQVCNMILNTTCSIDIDKV